MRHVAQCRRIRCVHLSLNHSKSIVIDHYRCWSSGGRRVVLVRMAVAAVVVDAWVVGCRARSEAGPSYSLPQDNPSSPREIPSFCVGG